MIEIFKIGFGEKIESQIKSKHVKTSIGKSSDKISKIMSAEPSKTKIPPNLMTPKQNML